MLVSKKMCVLCNGDQPLIPGMNYKGEYLTEHLRYHMHEEKEEEDNLTDLLVKNIINSYTK